MKLFDWKFALDLSSHFLKVVFLSEGNSLVQDGQF
jgi:hypothetical protein